MTDPKPDYEAMARSLLGKFSSQRVPVVGSAPTAAISFTFDESAVASLASALASVDSAAVARERKRLRAKVLDAISATEAHVLEADPRDLDLDIADATIKTLRSVRKWLDEALSEEP